MTIFYDRTLQVWNGSGHSLPRITVGHKESYLVRLPDYPRFQPRVCSTDLYAVITVYDITNRESYGALAWWFADRGARIPESTVKIIIGNKADKV